MPIFSHEGRENRRAEPRWTWIKHQEVAPTGKDDVLSQWSQFVFQREGKASRNSLFFDSIKTYY
jgi:hypothetical protein